MKRLSCIFLFCLSLALTSWGEGRATTWVVAKDGSGDYSVIQDALDVCAAGDTVRIGPGRYDELKVHTFALGGTAAVIMVPKISPLTIEGIDRDSVIVGPQVLTPTLAGFKTSCFVPDFSPENGLGVSGITFENVSVLASIRVATTVSLCRFRFMDKQAIQLLSAPNVHVLDCEFEAKDAGFADGILGYEGGSNPGLIVRNCTFRKLSSSIAITGSVGFEISGCYFEDIGSAAILQNHSTGIMRECEVGPSLPGVFRVGATVGSVVEVENVRFSESTIQLYVEGVDSELHGNHLSLTGGTYYTIQAITGGSLTLRDCDILNGGGQGTVLIGSSPASGAEVDLRECYWGTTDSTQIAQWIYDGNDDPQLIKVQYMPVLDKSITPAQEESIGGLKALFRGGH